MFYGIFSLFFLFQHPPFPHTPTCIRLILYHLLKHTYSMPRRLVTRNNPSSITQSVAWLKLKGTKYVSLADYCAMGNSEVSMKEGETVVLKKLGCAGWWYVSVLGKCHFPFLVTFICFSGGG